MTTASLPGLQAFVGDIGLDPIPSFAEADLLNNPIDIYHSYLAGLFQALVECDPELVYNSIQPSSTFGNGDLDIVLPKLKLADGISPKQLASELIKKVVFHFHFNQILDSCSALTLPYSSDSTPPPLCRPL